MDSGGEAIGRVGVGVTKGVPRVLGGGRSRGNQRTAKTHVGEKPRFRGSF